MLALLIALAAAAPIEGRVRLAGAPVPDARVEAIGVDGAVVAGPAFSDRDGRFSLDLPDGATLRVRRALRTEGGGRHVVLADRVDPEDAASIDLDRIDVGAGPSRMVASQERGAKAVVKAVRKAWEPAQEACAAVLDAPDRAAARAAAEAHRDALRLASGAAFEGCAERRFGLEADVAVAERFTHAYDAAAGAAEMRLWTGLASIHFARWCDEHGEWMRAQRAGGVATQRFTGVMSALVGKPEGFAARPLVAEAYEIEARAALAQGDLGAAVAKYHQALSHYTHLGDPEGMGRAELGIADAEARRGRATQAREHLDLARTYPLGPLGGARAWAVLAALGGEEALSAARAAAAAYEAVGRIAEARPLRLAEAELRYVAGETEAAIAAMDTLAAEAGEGSPFAAQVAEVRARLTTPPEPEPAPEPAPAPAPAPAP